MKARRTVAVWFAASVALAAALLVGCAGAKQPATRMAFALPAAVSPDGAFLASVPPSVEPSLFADEAPEFLTESLQSPALGSNVEARLRHAEARFQAGRRLFRAGQMEEARREFDQAIDVLLSGPRSGADGQAREKKLIELAEAIHQYDVSGLGAGEPEGEPVFEKSPLDEMPEPTFPIDPKLRNQVAEELKAASSQLPLTINDDVLRYINYFSSTRGRKTLLNGLRRAGRYRPMIQRIFDEEGIPQELIHLAQAESGFAPRAVSRVKATGMWQFMQWRGKEYGLLRTREKDDRLDPEKATRAAARHLRDLYTQFGDWHLAMAAYNCGPGNVEKAVQRTGYADVWEMRRRNVLPKETSNYLPIILAMVIMAKSPGHYGLERIEIDPPLEYSTVELDAPLHLNLVADITDRPVSEIRELNPALLTSVAPAGHFLHVPLGSAPAVLSALELIPASRRSTWRLYRVSEGDKLDQIARTYRTTAAQITKVNSHLASAPEPGSFLVVPAPPQPARRAARKIVSRRPAAAKKRVAVAPQTVAKTKPKAAAPGTSLVASKKAAARQSSTAVR